MTDKPKRRAASNEPNEPDADPQAGGALPAPGGGVISNNPDGPDVLDTPPKPEAPKPPPARVQKKHGHLLVSYGTWQISIAPDGLLMLPRHLHPRDVDDFVGCLAVAKDIAAHLINTNQKAAEKDDRRLPPRRAIVTQGPPPPGTTRMPVTPRASLQQRSASIGRQKRRGTEQRAATPTATPRPTRRNTK
jgi:hypothetical protein